MRPENRPTENWKSAGAVPLKYKRKRRPRPSFPFLRQAGHAASLPGMYYHEELNSLENRTACGG